MLPFHTTHNTLQIHAQHTLMLEFHPHSHFYLPKCKLYATENSIEFHQKLVELGGIF